MNILKNNFYLLILIKYFKSLFLFYFYNLLIIRSYIEEVNIIKHAILLCIVILNSEK